MIEFRLLIEKKTAYLSIFRRNPDEVEEVILDDLVHGVKGLLKDRNVKIANE